MHYDLKYLLLNWQRVVICISKPKGGTQFVQFVQKVTYSSVSENRYDLSIH